VTGELLQWGGSQGLECDRSAADDAEPGGAERWGCRLEVLLSNPAD